MNVFDKSYVYIDSFVGFMHFINHYIKCHLKSSLLLTNSYSGACLNYPMRTRNAVHFVSWNTFLCSTLFIDVLQNVMMIHTCNLVYQSLLYWPFVKGIHWCLVDSPHKGPITWKALSCNDVIIRLNRTSENYRKVSDISRTKSQN